MFNVQCLILAASKSRISPEAAACAAQAHGAQQPHMQANACRTAGKEGKIAEDISRTLHRLSFDLPRGTLAFLCAKAVFALPQHSPHFCVRPEAGSGRAAATGLMQIDR
eukprot:454210-Pelagomonas_calceolata.AAC.2